MQPANTLSSMAFVGVAAIVLVHWTSRRARSGLPVNRFNTRAAYPLLFAFALLVTGIGSAFYHARLSYTGQFVDVLGMYFIATFALVYSIDRVRGLSGPTIMAAYLGSNLLLAALLWWVPVARRLIFGLLIGGVILLETLGRKPSGSGGNARLLWIAIGILGVAFVIWMLDYERVMCSPHSLIQGHAVWHVLGAASAWMLYRYYRESVI